MFCRKALLPFGSHDGPPMQRIAAETAGHARLNLVAFGRKILKFMNELAAISSPHVT